MDEKGSSCFFVGKYSANYLLCTVLDDIRFKAVANTPGGSCRQNFPILRG